MSPDLDKDRAAEVEPLPAEAEPLLPEAEADVESLGEERLVGRLLALFTHDAVRKRVLAPIGFDAAILATNLATGIIVARGLGPSGRGELSATLLLIQMAAWLFGVANGEAISFHQSKHPEDGPKLMSSWLIATPPLALVGIGVVELALPAIFAAQTHHATELARIYAITIPLISFSAVFNGFLLGDEDFLYYNVTRFLMPAITAVCYAVFWALGVFTVELALFSNIFATVVMIGVAAYRTVGRYGLSRPDWSLFRTTFWYGAKAHAGAIAGLVNARLDLLIMPAFLAASSVGLYSVATNVTSIITTLIGTVALMVLPVAVRRTDSARQVILTLHATFAVAISLAIPLAILAPFALRLIYGGEFDGATASLRILLPGTVLQAGIMVLWTGMLAANKPLTVSLAVMPAAVMTVVGLIIFLPTGGIDAAAIVTSVVYAFEFTLLVILYRRTMGMRWSHFLRPPRPPEEAVT
jgi:O-antigen/teichoic acid export membrane protein